MSFEILKLSKHWTNDKSGLDWVDIEREFVSPFEPIETFSQTLKRKGRLNPILQCSRETWTKIHKLLHVPHCRQIYSSIWNNPSIKIGRQTIIWNTWVYKNIK